MLAVSETVSKLVNCAKMENVTLDMLKQKRTVTKDILAGIVIQMAAVIEESKTVLKSAVAKSDEQKSELLVNQKALIQTQQELIQCKTDKLDLVQKTVQTEIKTFSEVVKMNSPGNSMSTEKLKNVVRSAITDGDRPKNFLIFGANEEMTCDDVEMHEKEIVDDMFGLLKLTEKPAIEKIQRVGEKKSDSNGRPIKVTLRSAAAVQQVLRKAKTLKTVKIPGYSFCYDKLYLSPDRSLDERKSRQKLVQEMKGMIAKDSSKRYFIRNDKVCVAD